jgi:hypothetical protein
MGDLLSKVGAALNQGAAVVDDAASGGRKLFEGALEAARKMSTSDIAHSALDVAGMVPVVGEAADLTNAGLYALQGRKGEALLSLGSAIPGIGNAVTAAKWGKRAADVADAAGDFGKAAKYADEAGDIGASTAKAGKKADEAAEAGSRAVKVGDADLAAFRSRHDLSPDLNTVAAGRTNIRGLENETFFGASPKVRREAGLPKLEDGPIQSPNPNPLLRRHAEEDVGNQFVRSVEQRGLKAADLDGRTLRMHLSSDPCPTCKQGLKGTDVEPGVLKQLSDRYPGLEIRVTFEGRPTEMVIKGGRVLP